MGAVFRAVDARTGQAVALKLLAASDERTLAIPGLPGLPEGSEETLRGYAARMQEELAGRDSSPVR